MLQPLIWKRLEHHCPEQAKQPKIITIVNGTEHASLATVLVV